MISKDLYDNLSNLLEEVHVYVESTYGEHYAPEGEIQLIDGMEARGTLEIVAIESIDQYLHRYGKKAGKNRKDLLKATHYLLMLLQLNQPQKAPEKPLEPR